MNSLQKLLDKSKELRDAATQGPYQNTGGFFYGIKANGKNLISTVSENAENNDAFIVDACNTSSAKDAMIEIAVKALEVYACTDNWSTDGLGNECLNLKNAKAIFGSDLAIKALSEMEAIAKKALGDE